MKWAKANELSPASIFFCRVSPTGSRGCLCNACSFWAVLWAYSHTFGSALCTLKRPGSPHVGHICVIAHSLQTEIIDAFLIKMAETFTAGGGDQALCCQTF